MIYVSSAMFIWYLTVTIATIYGMAVEQKANKFDVDVGFIIGPLLTFCAAFIMVKSF